tara:strand:+ start:129 stop:422 length:294 start_codon:yes stop_codon:yes gene_type:complete
MIAAYIIGIVASVALIWFLIAIIIYPNNISVLKREYKKGFITKNQLRKATLHNIYALIWPISGPFVILWCLYQWINRSINYFMWLGNDDPEMEEDSD